MISESVIKKVTIDLLRNAVTTLPRDIIEALKKAHDVEEKTIPKMQLENIINNVAMAEDSLLPMCQDTGIQIFYVTLGKDMLVNVDNALIEGVRQATEEIPLRPNTVHPISRDNAGDNTGLRMPYINYRFSDEEYIEIAVMPKGAGSENMSALTMLLPSQGLRGIKEFVLNTMVRAGGKPCPPTIVGLGIGGSADISMKLAKESLLRSINTPHTDPKMAALERELYEAINSLGIGPMGLGGKTTVLGVNVEYAYCHTASLPVAVNIQCWAARKAIARIYKDGSVENLTHPTEGDS
jgi:fumarate hydratase subunit alpha